MTLKKGKSRMKKALALILAGGLLAGSGTALALDIGGDPAAGEQKAAVCFACHGEGGNSQNPMFPIIADQHADYLYHALKAYKSGTRDNPIMKAQVANLSDQDMRDLAAYFASQPSTLSALPRP